MTGSASKDQTMSSAREAILDLKARMAQSIIGQEQVVERLLLTLLCNGNVLVEGLLAVYNIPRISQVQLIYKAMCLQIVKEIGGQYAAFAGNLNGLIGNVKQASIQLNSTATQLTVQVRATRANESTTTPHGGKPPNASSSTSRAIPRMSAAVPARIASAPTNQTQRGKQPSA